MLPQKRKNTPNSLSLSCVCPPPHPPVRRERLQGRGDAGEKQSLKLDVPTILYRARRILWRLQADQSNRIDPTAATAVTTGRWGPTWQAFADRIIDAMGADAGQAELDSAIGAALLRATPPDAAQDPQEGTPRHPDAPSGALAMVKAGVTS